MILTNCAACAAPLPHKAKQCSRCKTRYCGPACQKKHWDEGGHDALCKKIKKGGGAEQYHADKKYKEAVAEAVEACADAEALYKNPAATLDDLSEAVNTLEEMERTARRVFGSAHPLVTNIEAGLREASMAFCVASMASW